MAGATAREGFLIAMLEAEREDVDTMGEAVEWLNAQRAAA
jgi:hypothetical protein